MKKIALWITMAAILLCVTACGGKDTDKTGTTTQKRADGKPSAQQVGTVYADKEEGFQLDAPQKGDTVAIMHTSMGDISIRFFPEAAPKTVENFLTHAKNGYYDGLLFHRVINDFMIQGGDPLGTGTGGESIWGGKFEDEFDSKLHNIRGSLAMANSGANTNGSQFFINQARPASFNRANYDYDSTVAMYKNYYEQGYKDRYATFEEFVEKAAGGINPLSYAVPEEVWKLYERTGGNINLDAAYREKAGHAVFGQVYEGMDVVDNIAAVITNSNDRPISPVVINSIEVTEYAG